MNAIKLVIFDVDGTLVDAYRAVHESLNYMLAQLGYRKASFTAAKRAVGWGDKKFVAGFVKKADFSRAILIYRQHHRGTLLRKSALMPGVKLVLRALTKEHMKLAVASNRPGKFCGILLTHLGIKKYFSVIACAKNAAEAKPNPFLLEKIMARLRVAQQETLYVGDMVIDVEAGRRAGVRVVAVKGGSSPVGALRRAKPERVIGSVSKLLEEV